MNDLLSSLSPVAQSRRMLFALTSEVKINVQKICEYFGRLFSKLEGNVSHLINVTMLYFNHRKFIASKRCLVSANSSRAVFIFKENIVKSFVPA